MRKKRLKVSVSGGRTSAYMAKLCKERLSKEYELCFVFANTSMEHPDTLRFLHNVDLHFELNLVWLEAVVHEGRIGSTFRLVDFMTAKRNGEVFEDVIKKYGIPNQTFKLCTRELKTNPMDAYMDSIGWNDYFSAIGIRIDESRRVSINATKQKIIYPLIDIWPTDKQDVIDYFSQFEWDLQIPEHQGNCIDCHKKTDKKLAKVLAENPRAFDFSLRMDSLYSEVGPNNVPGPRKRYRGYRNTSELLKVLQEVGEPSLSSIEEGGCSESCEPYETE